MQIINKRMTRDEMFKQYPRKWLSYGFEVEEDDDWKFANRNSSDGSYSAILIAVCDTEIEAVKVPFMGNGYKVKGMGVTNSIFWEDDYDEGEFFLGGAIINKR